MEQFSRAENLDGGGWWILFLIIFWRLAYILTATYFRIKGIPKFFRKQSNYINLYSFWAI